MIEIQRANDYQMCDITKKNGIFEVREHVFDPREQIGDQHLLITIATGFNELKAAQLWLDEKREEQRVNELYNDSDLAVPF